MSVFQNLVNKLSENKIRNATQKIIDVKLQKLNTPIEKQINTLILFKTAHYSGALRKENFACKSKNMFTFSYLLKNAEYALSLTNYPLYN
jgi:hypothetical protein